MEPPASSPSFFLRPFLFGTDWIDPARSIVIGIHFNKMQADEKPVMAAVIPFVRQNEDFHIAYNATAKMDHYIVSLPPGQGGPVSDQMGHDLDKLSRTPGDGVLSMEMAASQLMAKADQQIEKYLQTLEREIKAQPEAAGNLSPEDASQMFKGLIQIGKQVQTLSIGADITDSEFTLFSHVLAVPKTELSRLFSRNTKTSFSRMGNYTPRHHIHFRSGSYDMTGMIRFLNAVFGEFYKKIGLDLAAMETMAAHFTGETAGGLSFTDAGLEVEMIAVLNDTQTSGPDFLTSVYLPWIMDYGQKMADLFNQQHPDKPIQNIFSKMPGTTIDGHPVFGITGEIPSALFQTPGTESIKFSFRTIAIDHLLLTAADDDRLKQLISIAKTLEEKPLDGPLMRMDMDLNAYVDAVRKMTPAPQTKVNFDLPELGNLVYTLDMAGGKLSNTYGVRIKDILAMASVFQKIAAASAQDSRPDAHGQALSDALPIMPPPSPVAQTPKPPKEDTAAFWVDKGMLYATYGNDKEAIRFFEKALAIEPDNSRALFNLGLSHSSLGDYDQAVNFINKALSLEPDNGDFHYGLGWIYLLKGDAASAMPHIGTAADLGNPDARKYLMKTSPREQ